MNKSLFFEHFDLLAEAPNGVAKLRALILQLALQGKIDRQSPGDESAALILERVANEKRRLIVGKNGDRSEPRAPIASDELRFSIPRSWAWCRLDEISLNVHYGYTASADHGRTAVRMLRITDIQDNAVNWKSVPGCEIDSASLPGYSLRGGDILIARTGGTIGKSYLVKDLTERAVFASYLIRVIPSKEVHPPYVKRFLESQFYWKQLYAKSLGTGQPNVNSTSLKSLILPLPEVDP